MRPLSFSLAACGALMLAGCATTGGGAGPSAVKPEQLSGALNRVSWGVNLGTYQQAENLGYDAWLEQQLHPAAARLPAAAQAQIDAMTITQKPLVQLNQDLEQQRKD